MVKRPEQERIRIEKIGYLEEKGVKPSVKDMTEHITLRLL